MQEILTGPAFYIILSIFVAGYLAIILEYYLKVNKTAVALLIAVLCWVAYFLSSANPLDQDVAILGKHVSDASQIIFFLMGAMTLVELIDAHNGFKIITGRIRTSSKVKMLWLLCAVTFFLSAVLDNLTTTILMVSLLRKLLPKGTAEEKKEKILFCCMVVVAANAGGAWTPMGDVTTTMLWINGQLSALAVIRSLFTPSLISVLIPIGYFSFKLKGHYSKKMDEEVLEEEAPGAKAVLALGVASLAFVPIFKALTGLPPFMGVLLGLSVLWLFTDAIHLHCEKRVHLRIPHVLTKIDTSGIMFFLGILLAVNALEAAGMLGEVATWLDNTVRSQEVIATLIGIFSAIIDNVPLVAATMGMYSLADFPMDSSLWHMIAYTAGTGGSMLIIGSSSGIALMGMEKIDFVTYMKKMTIPVFVGYIAGIVYYVVFERLTGIV